MQSYHRGCIKCDAFALTYPQHWHGKAFTASIPSRKSLLALELFSDFHTTFHIGSTSCRRSTTPNPLISHRYNFGPRVAYGVVGLHSALLFWRDYALRILAANRRGLT